MTYNISFTKYYSFTVNNNCKLYENNNVEIIANEFCQQIFDALNNLKLRTKIEYLQNRKSKYGN